MNVLVTGSAGFIGRHMVEALGRREETAVHAMDRGWSAADFEKALRSADVIFHIAGVNRPPNPEEFQIGNAEFTQEMCERLKRLDRQPLIVFTSSVQAALANPYGESKRAAEETLAGFARDANASVAVFRLKNVFGKWCRPNYNSVTATFCHNIARDLPIQISDEARKLELVYIDDVVAALLGVLSDSPAVCETRFYEVGSSYQITLGDLAARIRSFRESRNTLRVPNLADEFNRKLYATYLSYLKASDFAYPLDQKIDPRGVLAEFAKSPPCGQIFVSRTKPGIVRGNHYHHTKTEKFLVVEGEGIVRFRQIHGSEVLEYRVSGADFRVVDIPPGYTHSIENIGSGEMVTLFWASEIFDPSHPDTYFVPVK